MSILLTENTKVMVQGITGRMAQFHTKEMIEYGMLGYTDFANLAAQKNYVSLYVSPEALAAHKKKYSAADCGKSCLRFNSKKNFDPVAIRDLLERVKELPIDRRSC